MSEYDDKSINIRQLILMTTQHCNLDCIYCYESYKSSRKMTVDIAKKIIIDEFSKAPLDGRTQSFLIDFMGGEPLSNFKLIKAVSEWLWNNNWFLNYKLAMRTNGTLLTPEIKKWLLTNREKIEVGLSLDGLGWMNKVNRTHHAIDYQFFAETWPSKPIRTTLFVDSIHLLADTIIEMSEQGLSFDIEFGSGFEWTCEAAIKLEEQMALLIPYFIDKPQKAFESHLFSMDISDFFSEYNESSYEFCGGKDNLIAYDVDGESYICHLFTPVVLGVEKALEGKQLCGQQMIIPLDGDCQTCPIHSICKSCYAQNLKVHGNIWKSAAKVTICRAMKVQARACATLFIRRIEKSIQSGNHIDLYDIERTEKAIRLLETIPSAQEF